MSKGSVGLHEVHRWLNPFAKQRSKMIIAKTPEEIEDALRPELYDLNWRHLPFDGYFGQLESWGFILERQSNQKPVLIARYGPMANGTRLSLTVGRAGRGMLSWIWNVVILPIVVAGNLILMYQNGGDILSGPISGDRAIQTAVAALVVVWGPVSIGRFLVNSYRHRDDLSYYKQVLSQVIDARDLGAED
jgi:hypothetical protein